MPKIRIHELAKQLSVDSKILINKLNEIGIETKNHMSSITSEQVSSISKHFKKNDESAKGTNMDSNNVNSNNSNINNTNFNNEKTPVVKEKPTLLNDSSNNQNNAAEGNTNEKPKTPNNKPTGERTPYQGNRPAGDRPPYQGNRPAGDRPPYQGNRPAGDRPPYQGNRPAGDRPPYQGNRPAGDRPPYQGNRPAGDRPPYQGNRPAGDRPPYQGNRPAGDRPPYQGNRPAGDRPPYQGNRPAGDRPPYQGNRPAGDRPPYQGNRPAGDRPPYQGNRPAGDRPPYQGNRPAGDRPPYQGNRPAGDRPPYQGNRPAGDRPPYQGNRPAGGGYGNKVDDKSRPYDKTKEKPTASQAIEKPAKEHNRRLNPTPVKVDKSGKPYVRKDSEKPMAKPVLKNMIKLKPVPKPVSLEPKIIKVPSIVTLKELAEIMNVSGNELIKSLIKKGNMITINEEIDFTKASEIAEDYNFLVEEELEIDVFEKHFSVEPETEDELEERPPVVVVMGHVDHGKTSLLDAIRHKSVTESEAGGITQHIGAYTAKAKGKRITFLDTPGHEAFTAMRMRGASITDIAILVVAADDGVMPQTIEAINHAKAADVDIIVAINKIDLPSANPDRVKQELTEYGVIVEDFGGETICVNVSAKENIGIETLLEMVMLTSEIKELKASPRRKARGTVIEARLDKGRGPVATVLIQNGTLNIGDPIVAGKSYGKIRAMISDKGANVKTATPSIPVEILGLSTVPKAGDMFYVAESEKHARQVSEAFTAKGRVEMTNLSLQKVSLEDLFVQIKDGQLKDLNLIVKGDVQGSVEALSQSLIKLSNEEVRVKIIHAGVGAINESDVTLASTSGAIIIGFNVRPEASASTLADEQGIDMRLYKVIYSAIEEVEAAMKGMLDPIFAERIVGHAEIRQIFKSSGAGTIGGCYVIDGAMLRNAKARLIRGTELIYEGVIDQLKRFKDDAKEVKEGFECGISFNKFNLIEIGDVIEAFVIEEVAR